MLALQPLDRLEPLLDRGEPRRVGLDPLQVAAQLAGQVAQLDREAAEPIADRVQLRVDPGGAPQQRLGLGQRARRAAAVLLGTDRARPRGGGGFAQALGVAQPLALGVQPGLLGRVGRHLLDLRQLVAVEVEVALARAVALAQLGQLRLQPAALAVGLAVAVAQLQVLGPGEAVEHLHLGRGDRQLAVLVLAVEGEQATAEQLQLGGARGAAGEEGGGAAGGGDAAAEDDLLGLLGQARGDLRQLRLLQQPGRQVEDALHPGLPGPRPDDLRPRLAAHQQVERVGEHRLPRAGLAGDRVQPLAEPQLGLLDQQQVLDPKLTEHTLLLAPGAAGGGYAGTGSAGGVSLLAWTKSRWRTRAKPAAATTKERIEPIRRISLKPLTKATLAAWTTSGR